MTAQVGEGKVDGRTPGAPARRRSSHQPAAGGALGMARFVPATAAMLAPYAALDAVKIAVACASVPALRRLLAR